MLTWPDKDPDEVLDYQLDWSARLDGDTITTSTWTVPAGITEDSKTYTDTSAKIWLSGGTSNTVVVLTNHVVTAGGRSMDQSVKLRIKQK